MNGRHGMSVLLMLAATLMWSIAGVVTRHLDVARGFEVTLWRSAFAALFVGAYLLLVRRDFVSSLRAAGWLGLFSGLMWATMFCCFMLALTRTTVANTLIMESLGPLATAVLAFALLGTRVPARTWLAIAVATGGLIWMFVQGFDTNRVGGMWIAFGVPLASALNIVAMKKAGHAVDLIPAVFLGGLFSALLMLPLAWPLQASLHDVALMALLGVVQLGFPCMLMVRAARHLQAPELALLGLLEVIFGTLWAWLGAGEVPASATLTGGAVVIAALVFNELANLRSAGKPAN